jgi:hypothetical protein
MRPRCFRRKRVEREPMPRHPVTVRVSLQSGDIVVQGKDVQIEAIAAALARSGVDLEIASKGLCG